MLFVTADLIGDSWWTRMGWGYLSALHEAEVDYRLTWRAKTNAAVERGATPEPWHPILDHHLRCDSWAERDKSVLFIGTVADACRYIRVPEEAGARNVALVEWGLNSIPEKYVDGLNDFEGVIVPSPGAYKVLAAAGVERLAYVAPPAQPELYYSTPHERGATKFVAIGRWHSGGTISHLVDEYVKTFGPTSPVELVLVCPDAPFHDARSLARTMLVDDAGELPSITLVGLGEDLHHGMLQKIFDRADVYISTTGRSDLDPYLLDAAAADLAIIAPQRIGGWLREYDVPYWRSGTHGELVGSALRVAAASGHFDGARKCLSYRGTTEAVGGELSTVIKALLRREKTDYRPQPRVLTVIPFRDRSATDLRAALESLGGAPAVVVDQGSRAGFAESANDVALQFDVPFIGTTPPESGEFSIARCRNAGARFALEDDYDIVFFLDVDCCIPTGYLDHVATVVRPGTYLVPFIGNERPATGCVAVAVSDLVDAGGYDEEHFEGWGSEDIDFLQRLDAHGGVRSDSHPLIVAQYQHEHTAEQAAQGERNRAILDELDANRGVTWNAH